MKRITIVLAAILAMPVMAQIKVTDVTSSPEVIVSELKELPEGCNVMTSFELVLEYQGYAFEALMYPLHNKKWIVLSKWCLDEEETIYMEDENGNEIQAKTRYKDPFEGMEYPVIKTDSVSFMTRNYSGQTIKMYAESVGKRTWDKFDYVISLDVLDADVKTRRVFCRTNPNDWCWGVPETEDEKEFRHPYKSMIGWVDEEWICNNLLTTCP